MRALARGPSARTWPTTRYASYLYASYLFFPPDGGLGAPPFSDVTITLHHPLTSLTRNRLHIISEIDFLQSPVAQPPVQQRAQSYNLLSAKNARRRATSGPSAALYRETG